MPTRLPRLIFLLLSCFGVVKWISFFCPTPLFPSKPNPRLATPMHVSSIKINQGDAWAFGIELNKLARDGNCNWR